MFGGGQPPSRLRGQGGTMLGLGMAMSAYQGVNPALLVDEAGRERNHLRVLPVARRIKGRICAHI
jgi:hypothetical protein